MSRTHLTSEIRTSAWSAGSIAGARIWAQVMQITAFLIAARVFGPADFGVYTMVQAVALGFTILSSSGWREHVILRPAQAGVALYMAIICALGTGSLLVVGGWIGQSLSWHGDFLALSILLALALPLQVVSNVIEGIALREGRQPIYAACTMVAETVYVAAVAALIWADVGLIALGVARIVMSVSYLAASLFAVRPPWPAAGTPALRRDGIRFARGIIAARVADYVANNAATLIVGTFLGPAAAGLYRAASRLVGAAFEAVTEAARSIAWRGVSGTNAQMTPARANALLSAVWAVSFPASFGLALVGPDLIAVTLGPAWESAGGLVAIIAFRRLLTAAYTPTEAALSQNGQTLKAAQISGIMVLCAVVGLSLGTVFGLTGAAVGHLAAGCLGGMIVLRAFHAVSAVSLRDLALAAARPLLASLAMVAGITVLVTAENPVVYLIASTALGALIYVTCLFSIWPEARALAKLASSAPPPSG